MSSTPLPSGCPTSPFSVNFPDVLESVPDGIAVADVSCTVVFWNRTAVALTGWLPEDVIGRSLDWLFALDSDEAGPFDRSAVDAHHVRGSAWRQCKDGERFWCEHSTFAVRSPEDTITGYVTRFRAAAATQPPPRPLPDGDRRISSGLNGGGIVVFEQDLELRYQWVSAVPSPLGVVSVHEIVGRTDEEVLPREGAQAVAAAKRQVIASGHPAAVEFAFAHDGERRAARISIGTLCDPDGSVIGIRGVAVDATAHLQAEERLRDSYRRLAAAEKVARMGSWEYDVATDRVAWSDGAYAILGRGPDELPDHLVPSPEHIHPDDRARRDVLARRAVESGESFELDYRIIRGDGRVRSLHVRVEVITDDEARPVKLIGTFRDVTEADESARTLQTAAEELARRAVELREQVRDHGPGGGSHRPADPTRNLSVRQREILALVAQGLNNLEIADQLYLTENTVKWHMGKILKVLGVANRAQAIATYLRAVPPVQA